MSNIEDLNNTPEGMLEVTTQEVNTPFTLSKYDMFSNEIANITIPKNLNITSKILLNKIHEIGDQPEDSYPKCFRSQYVKAGPIGFRNDYNKKC